MGEDRLKISVVVIAYNEEKHIRACVESLAALDYPSESFEVLVVDNASTDGTGAAAEEAFGGRAHMRVALNPVPGSTASGAARRLVPVGMEKAAGRDRLDRKLGDNSERRSPGGRLSSPVSRRGC